MIPAVVTKPDHRLQWIIDGLDGLSGEDKLFFLTAIVARAEQNGVEAAAREADRLRRLAGRAEMARERDRLIREALQAIYGGMSRTAASKRLAEDLRRYVSGGWSREARLDALPPGASDARRAHHAILRANAGRPLAERRILEISA